MKKFIEKNKETLRTIGEIIAAVWTAVFLGLDLAGLFPENTRWKILTLIGFIAFTIQVFFDIYSLRKQLTELLSPKLDLVFGDYSSCCHHWEADSRTNTLYRVGAVNLGGKTIEDVHVSLENFEPQGFTFGPIKLIFMNHKGNDEESNLHPGKKPTVFIDVIQASISKNQSMSMFFLQVAVNNVPNAIIPGDYRLNLLAEGKDVPPCRKTFLITWDGESTNFSEER